MFRDPFSSVIPDHYTSAKTIRFQGLPEVFPSERLNQLSAALFPAAIMDNMSDASGLCLQDLVNSQGQAGGAGGVQNSGSATTNGNPNDHLHSHHSSLHDSVAAAVSVSSAITGLMSGGAVGATGPLGHLHHHTGHDLSGHHHHHHHHNLGPHTPSLHEPLEKLKSK